MGQAVHISNDDLLKDASNISKIQHRSMAKQIEHWAILGRCAEANADLPLNLIQDILGGLHEIESGEGTVYQFEE